MSFQVRLMLDEIFMNMWTWNMFLMLLIAPWLLLTQCRVLWPRFWNKQPLLALHHTLLDSAEIRLNFTIAKHPYVEGFIMYLAEPTAKLYIQSCFSPIVIKRICKQCLNLKCLHHTSYWPNSNWIYKISFTFFCITLQCLLNKFDGVCIVVIQRIGLDHDSVLWL